MWTLEDLIKFAAEAQAEVNGKWVPARPLIGPLLARLRSAWAVLRGQADAFVWPEGQ